MKESLLMKCKSFFWNLLLVSFASLFLTVALFADVVYLKNGRKVTGEIFAESDTQISVKTATGRVIIRKADVDRISKEEAEINYLRNGDYLILRGEYDLAVEAYESALRLEPNNQEIINKLEDARRKVIDKRSVQMAPEFAKGDDFMNRGYYESAFNAYMAIPKAKDGNAAYVEESGKKIKVLQQVMLSRAQDYLSQQDYNKAFQIYSIGTTVLTGELFTEMEVAFNEAQKEFFKKADESRDSGLLAKAASDYRQLYLTYTGEFVRKAVDARLYGIGVPLTYNDDSTQLGKYVTRILISVPQTSVAPWTIYQPGNVKNLSLFLENTFRPDGQDEAGLTNVDLTVSRVSVNIEEFNGTKVNAELADAAGKKAPGLMSLNGKFERPVDMGKILVTSVVDGTNASNNALAGILGFLSRFPFLKEGEIKLNDEWKEPLNERRSVGPLELNTIGTMKYKVVGFESYMDIDCIKLEMEANIYNTLQGTIAINEGQQKNIRINYETPLKGYAYIDHTNRILTRYSLNGDLKYKGSSQIIQTVSDQNAGQTNPQNMDGAMMMPGMDPAMMDPAMMMRPGMGMQVPGQPVQGQDGTPQQIVNPAVSIPETTIKISIEQSFLGSEKYEIPVSEQPVESNEASATEKTTTDQSKTEENKLDN